MKKTGFRGRILAALLCATMAFSPAVGVSTGIVQAEGNDTAVADTNNGLKKSDLKINFTHNYGLDSKNSFSQFSFAQNSPKGSIFSILLFKVVTRGHGLTPRFRRFRPSPKKSTRPNSLILAL